MNLIETVSPFVESGFAIHWLHPKQKRPIGDKWQERPVATIATLRSDYSPDYNVGVRLGEPSRVEGGYLHVIDMDIRIASDTGSAWEALRDLFPGVNLTALPTVQSGSGGESRHLYFVTDKSFQSRKLAVSGVKFTDAKGPHWTWEIELFGTGKQVAMPPSIHPDTGKPYVWVTPFDLDALNLGVAPEIPSAAVEDAGAKEETGEPFYGDEGPLSDIDEDAARKWLGRLADHRGADYDSWYQIGMAIHHQFAASAVGLELFEEFSKSRPGYKKNGTRGKWRSYGRRTSRRPTTFRTVIGWARDDQSVALADEFDDLDAETEVEDEFDELLTAEQASDDDWDGGKVEESEAAPSWKSLLAITDEGEIKANLHNLRLVVENDVWTRGVVAFNEFTQEVVQRGKPGLKSARRKNASKPVLQLDGSSWFLRDPVNGDFWTEDKDNAIRALIEAPKTQGGYGIKVPDRDLRAAIDIVGRKNCFHPVREYLSAVKWDGSPRVERLFIDYLGAPDDAYTRNVARLMMVAGVARIFEPGAKFDFAVILQGLQGKRKSTFISTLAKSWFAELEGDMEDPRQMVEAMQGSWLLEIPELGGFVRADVRHVKAFISRRSDKVRLAYAKRAQEYHRQCVFIGSTNDDKYLKDDTGNRRFWPIFCSVDEIDTDRLMAEVDQLWAEARALYEAMRKAQPKGTLPLYLADAESRDIAARLQESARVESVDDAVAGQIAAWLDAPIVSGSVDEDLGPDGQPRFRNETCLIELWVECLGKDRGLYNQQTAQTLGRAMSKIPAWKADGRFMTFSKWGRQRVYERFGWQGRLDRMSIKTG
jgi:hypothetical protein